MAATICLFRRACLTMTSDEGSVLGEALVDEVKAIDVSPVKMSKENDLVSENTWDGFRGGLSPSYQGFIDKI